MIRYPYTNERKVQRFSAAYHAQGVRCLQRDPDERARCDWLLRELDPPHGARVLDIASGFGGVADQMRERRPDLDFTLLNVSPSQLALSSAAHVRVCGEMEKLPFADASFDCALICYALGHGDAPTVLREARRVAKSVIVFDILARDRDAWRTALNYCIPEVEALFALGWIELQDESDGGRFDALMPGFWSATGAREFLMRVN